MAQQQQWQSDRPWLAGVISIALVAGCPATWAIAQVAGDGSLGTQVNGAAITPCTGRCIITNGTTRGGNLFHSFRRFSLPNGDFAGFVTTPTIQNVIVRVTGVGSSFISNINGTIATSNPANFFLLNPNGILFGPNTTLNIGGSFLATTASRMQFADGTEFRTDAPTPLLTISVPIGLQFGQTPGSIAARRVRLLAGQTDSFSDVALVGGNVTLDNSAIQTPSRRITLSGVGENGVVGVAVSGDRLNINLPAGIPRQNISLSNTSILYVASSGGGGGIDLIGRNIHLDEGFVISGIVQGVNNAPTNQAGTITIDATANFQLTQGSAVANEVPPSAIGQGGDINITAANIQAFDGSNIATRSGGGKAGNVQVTTNTLTLDGVSEDDIGSGIGSILVGSSGNARGGGVIIQTNVLTLTNGGVVSTNAFGNGISGDVIIKATTINLDGSTPDNQSPSGISSQIAPGFSGRGGNITIETDSLTATNGANVSASTFGRGNAGNVQIIAKTIALDGTTPDGTFSSGVFSAVNSTGVGQGGEIAIQTNSLRITNGAAVSNKTFGVGNAGNMRITANTIAVDGVTPDGQFASAISSEVSRIGSGNGGNVSIQTGSLAVTNRAIVNASNLSSGSAGNLDITAQTIRLDRGDITASAASGDGANITLNVGDLLLLRNKSRISTNAGTAQAGGDGGNITINAPNGFIVGVLKENSDITANAFTGRGGRVDITAQGVYGLKFQPSLTPFSDITASSQFGISGVVNLNVLNIDPSRGLIELPINLTDPAQQIAQGCSPGGKTAAGQFTATGRGGIPLSPDEALESRAVVTKWVPLPTVATDVKTATDVKMATDVKADEPDKATNLSVSSVPKSAAPSVPKSAAPSAAPIVEAQGWIIHPDGTVELVANVSTSNLTNFGVGACPTAQRMNP
jgi:filamentous hemagglutinin family protein